MVPQLHYKNILLLVSFTEGNNLGPFILSNQLNPFFKRRAVHVPQLPLVLKPLQWSLWLTDFYLWTYHHTHWPSVTHCFSQVQVWCHESEWQPLGQRGHVLHALLLLRTQAFHFIQGINSNKRQGSVQPVQQIRDPDRSLSFIEYRDTSLSHHFSLKCFNSFKESPQYLWTRYI